MQAVVMWVVGVFVMVLLPRRGLEPHRIGGPGVGLCVRGFPAFVVTTWTPPTSFMFIKLLQFLT